MQLVRHIKKSVLSECACPDLSSHFPHFPEKHLHPHWGTVDPDCLPTHTASSTCQGKVCLGKMSFLKKNVHHHWVRKTVYWGKHEYSLQTTFSVIRICYYRDEAGKKNLNRIHCSKIKDYIIDFLVSVVPENNISTRNNINRNYLRSSMF